MTVSGFHGRIYPRIYYSISGLKCEDYFFEEVG